MGTDFSGQNELDLASGVTNIRAMNFILAVLAWLLIAAVLVVAVVLATHGKLLMLVIALVLFVLAFSKWGCATH
ncbi:MAG TPA: hypothetical protein VNM37_09415 [Candidatus Dormibacteraeota bacterium]|nr:hypothetical protein [Candidatus Dormibacteraeota bacterium]